MHIKCERYTLVSGFGKMKNQPTKTLTSRERDILMLLRLGKTNDEIANQLGLSVNTVKTHLKNLFRKLEVRNRTEASFVQESSIDMNET